MIAIAVRRFAASTITHRSRLGRVALGAAAALALLVGAPQAGAQNLQDRIDRLERELQTLQRTAYGGGGRSPVPGNPYSTAPVPGAAAAPSGSDAARLEVRMSELEQVLATVTGRLEELTFQNQSLQNRLDKLIGDVDYRLRALEQGQRPGGDAGMPPPVAMAPPMGAPAQAMPPQAGFGQVPPGAVQTPAGRTSMTVPSPGGSPMPPIPPAVAPAAGVPAPSSQPGVLGTMSTAELAAAQRQQAAAPPPPPAMAQPAVAGNVALPAGSARDQYEYAYGLLRQRDYANAETAFRQFVDRHKTDELTGNALYWLGETHYVRRQFEPAAMAFLDGYKNFPKGSKAPDNLLKLGMSLAAMNRQKEACTTLTKFNNEFGDAPQNLKAIADNERRKLACT
ncbi:MAG: tol-pal system protein YbgF [Rhodospirillales bacterium]|nr:tol-pal system protein YbgF [Rhodospirillales bacterium]